MSAFIRMSDKLAQNREELLGDLIRQLEKLQSRTSTSGRTGVQLNRQIADVNAQSLVVAQLYKNGVLNHAEYASRSGELDRKVSELRSERRRILTEDEDDEIIESLKELNETIAEYVPTDSFDTGLVRTDRGEYYRNRQEHAAFPPRRWTDAHREIRGKERMI